MSQTWFASEHHHQRHRDADRGEDDVERERIRHLPAGEEGFGHPINLMPKPRGLWQRPAACDDFQ
jgi:hypothetical protein